MIECGAFSEKSFLSRLYYLLESFIIKRASEIVIIGKNLREYIRSMGRTKIEKCPVIYNCVDLEECEKLLSDIGVDNNIDNKHVTFGYIGSLYNFEGLDDLIRVFSKIKAKYSNCELIIVGSGECLSDLKKLADDLFVEVTFTGRIERERIGEYYNKIDVIVLPRKDLIVTNQVTPLKPLEAMGFKKAVIGSNVGGMQEIIDGSNGVLYRAGDNKDLYKKMEQFIINPSLINDFGRIGNKWVSQHRNWLVEISKYTRLYERILKK
jgi:glycosyltransferase involved in cell wall biosynthesis